MGPRHRRLLSALLGEQLQWNELTADHGVRLAQLTAAVDAVPGEELTEQWLVEALAHAVDFARYWQEPDDVDRVLARPAIRAALAPLADRVAAVRPAWWTAAVVPHEQWLLEWDGVDVPPVDAAVALARWRQDTLDDEQRAAERPSDVRANYSGYWWSAPSLSGLPSTIPAGLAPAGAPQRWVRTDAGWRAAS